MADKTPASKIRAQIDENLKRIYDDIAQEEVPARFRMLLEQLRQKTVAAPTGNGKSSSSKPPAEPDPGGEAE